MLDQLVGQSLANICSNARLLEHRCGIKALQVANANLFRAPGWESRRPYDVPPKGQGKDMRRSLVSSRNRAKSAVRNIAYNNRFCWFFTGTIDPKQMNRYDAAVVGKKLQNWLRNMSARHGLVYLILGEHHKDGAIHFHGFLNLGDLEVAPAINPHTGAPIFRTPEQQVYNLPSWTFGFSEVIPIDEHYERTCNYLLKYFTKDYQKIFGKWYFASRNLVRKPQITLVHGMDYEAFVEQNPDAGIVPVYNDICIASLTISS